MLRYKCLVLDHDDTVVQSESTVNYPCFCQFLEQFRPGMTISLEEYVGDCNKKPFIDMCKDRFSLTDDELQQEYLFWKAYAKTHIPEPFPGIGKLLRDYRNAGGTICVSSMSSQETILRDYRTHFGIEPDAVYGWDLEPEQRKPSPYALEQIMAQFGFTADEILVVDDMKFAASMARSAGCAIAFAGWGRLDFPVISQEMGELCDYTFHSIDALQIFLFGE